MMTEKMDEFSLEDWDLDAAEDLPPVDNAGVVVPVKFVGKEFDAVDEAAERAGTDLAEFIRDAALEKARFLRQPPRWTGGSEQPAERGVPFRMQLIRSAGRTSLTPVPSA